MKTIIVALVLALSGFFVPAQASHLTNNQYENRVQAVVNTVRDNHNLSTLTNGACLDRSAENYAQSDGILVSGTPVHSNLGFVNGCNGVRAGETLALGYHRPGKVVRAWMRSPGHRRVLMTGSYDKIGIGVVRTPHGPLVVAQFLAK